jgi:hypothetical protein
MRPFCGPCTALPFPGRPRTFEAVVGPYLTKRGRPFRRGEASRQLYFPNRKRRADRDCRAIFAVASPAKKERCPSAASADDTINARTRATAWRILHPIPKPKRWQVLLEPEAPVRMISRMFRHFIPASRHSAPRRSASVAMSVIGSRCDGSRPRAT